jgi:hypothetical protein
MDDHFVFMLGSCLTGTCEVKFLHWWTFHVSGNSGFNMEFQNRGFVMFNCQYERIRSGSSKCQEKLGLFNCKVALIVFHLGVFYTEDPVELRESNWQCVQLRFEDGMRKKQYYYHN